MAIREKKRNDVDSLLADLGVLDLPDGIDVDFNDRWTKSESLATLATSESEDPYAKWLTPPSENVKGK